jgi:[protein-PII] uridylyltransferase
MVMLQLHPEQPIATAIREGRDGSSEFILCTRDRHGLYASVAGVLTAHGVNIFGAHVYTTRSGMALEVYRVSTPPGGENERSLMWEEFEQTLRKVLEEGTPVEEVLRRRGRRIGLARAPSKQPVRVSISNTESDFYTIADVVGNDRLGLLHDLTRAVADCGVEVYISKAAMILDQVTDTFYLKDSQGKKIQDPELLERIRIALQAAAERGGEGGAG